MSSTASDHTDASDHTTTAAEMTTHNNGVTTTTDDMSRTEYTYDVTLIVSASSDSMMSEQTESTATTNDATSEPPGVNYVTALSLTNF